MTRHLFVVNPTSKTAPGLAAECVSICAGLGFEHAVKVSGFPGDTIGIVRDEAVSGRGRELRVYVLGGDGSLNEAVCGGAGEGHLSITSIPCGTGNDFIRCFGGKEVFLNLEGLIKSTRETMLDLIDVAIGDEPPRHAINICSVGVDADVAAGVRRYKWAKRLGSKMPYNLALFTTVLRGVKRPYKVTVDGEIYGESLYTILTCCNGQVYGGGFKACPDADPADGQLEFLLVKGIGRATLTRVVGKYAAGRYKELPQYIEKMSGDTIGIESKTPFYVNCDGEVFRGNRASFSLSPHKMRFILPE
jgi:diacylglycerol kinase (ATP)